MASNSNFEAKVLMAKGKRATAAYVHADCSDNPSPRYLNEVLDNLLNPITRAIDEWDTIDWCKWLIAGGRTPDEFHTTVRTFDTATTCGLVWTPHFVAYRCRTCGISPCMSLCTDCFKKGNHERHDFNMFLSQAGGACDCGDTSVMKETGFCDRHGPNKASTSKAHNVPMDLMCVAEAMMPRIILRLIQHLREHSHSPDAYKSAIQDCDGFITMLSEFNKMGGLMRRVMTAALTNPQKYRELNEVPEYCTSELAQYYSRSWSKYEEAVRSFPNPEPALEFKDWPSLQQYLEHKTFLEELVFWTVKFEFPQRLVCMLLDMLPDPDYKEALTRAFVLHYSRISLMLERSSDPDKLSNRVVHVSVQLFSNQQLALKMAEEMNLLHVMVISLKYMMKDICVRNTLHDHEKNHHYVVDCSKPVMKDHCYWPLVSDLSNVLSHEPVSLKFMNDENLLEMWFEFLSMFQGMNVNVREQNQHVEFEPQSYYAAFSAELEASAYPMWAQITHLNDPSTAVISKRVLSICLKQILKWFDDIGFTMHDNDGLRVSFHLPLHRHYSSFLCRAIAKQEVTLDEVLPSAEVLYLLMMHPLQIQVAFHEILHGLWVRNGLQMKGQAMTYIQCNFCNSMVDADLYLLQVCSTRIASETMMNTIIDRFHVREWMTLMPSEPPNPETPNSFTEVDQNNPMLESFLTFLIALTACRINLGMSETAINRIEMVTLLCMGDKTHSQLMEMMPERCSVSQSRDFESVLAEVADYKAPALEATGTMQQGMYVPRQDAWETLYDPVHVLLRAVHKKDFQTSMDRYAAYGKSVNKLQSNVNPWPPFRTPVACASAYDDPRHLFRSRVFHAVAFIILYKASKNLVSESITTLIIYMLEQAVIISQQNEEQNEDSKISTSRTPVQSVLNDMDLSNWYRSDSLFDNLQTVIGRVKLDIKPECSPITYSSDSDSEWEYLDPDAPMSDGPHLSEAAPPATMLMLQESSVEQAEGWQVALHEGQQGMVVYREPSLALDTPLPPVLALPPAEGVEGDAVNPVMEVEVEDGAMAVAIAGSVGASEDSEESANAEMRGLPWGISGLLQYSPRPALVAGNEVGRNPPSVSSDSSNKELIPSTSQHRKCFSRRKPLDQGYATPQTVKVQESIVSLLLKIHSNLSGVPDSFNIDEEEEKAARPGNPVTEAEQKGHNVFGDGAYFVGRLLRRMATADANVRNCIKETRIKLWPTEEEREEARRQREMREKEERKRRAKERQQRILGDMKMKQQQFMENVNMMDMDDETTEEEVMVTKQEYCCGICNTNTTSTEDEPMGLVVLVQATGVIGHCRREGNERCDLPVSEEDKSYCRKDETLAAEYDRRVEELDRHFDPESWYLSVNQVWDGGIHVQTCGHHIHLHCLTSYLNTLKQAAQRQNNQNQDKGEYYCPLCRQLSNSVLPLSPQLGDRSQMVRANPSTSMSQLLVDLSRFLNDNDQKPSTSNMAEAIGKAMEDMSRCTQLKSIFKKTEHPTPQSLFLFVISIARTNLEIDVIQRGGSLVVDPNIPPNPLLRKRDCIVPLLHVLSAHARVLAPWSARATYQKLCGTPETHSPIMDLISLEREIPILLHDPSALLLQFILLLPLHLDQIYFTTTVRVVFNLLYYQLVVQVSCGLTGGERAVVAEGARTGPIRTLAQAMALINKVLGRSDLYMIDDEVDVPEQKVDVRGIDQQIQKLALPFLRIAALLKYYVYSQPLPEIGPEDGEFLHLAAYLELCNEPPSGEEFNAACALNWPDTGGMWFTSPETWCQEYAAFVAKSQIAARLFIVDQHITWSTPRLLNLPREYEKIFSYYHERPCSQCHSVPQEASVCLMCGTIVCLKQSCCKHQNMCEAVAHSLECGSGTAIFLVITSTYVIVIRGHRACLWGSIYLDEYQEEDKDLKRGKPLYLCKDRYQMLEHQWLAHRFDNIKKNWVIHRNAI